MPGVLWGGIYRPLPAPRPHWQLFRVVIERSRAVAATPGQRLPPTAPAPTPFPGWGGIIHQPPGRNSAGLWERPHGVAWCGVCLRRAGRSNRQILRHKSGRNVPGWGVPAEDAPAEVVLEVQRVRAWPSSACPVVGHVPAVPWHTSSCQGTRGTGSHHRLPAVALCGTPSTEEGPC